MEVRRLATDLNLTESSGFIRIFATPKFDSTPLQYSTP